jgi:hypothetical protein
VLVSKKDFAAIYGCSKAYISQLIKAERLVLCPEGRQVDVDASLERLGATADPSKAGVRERWADYRQQHGQQPAAAVAPPAPPAVASPPAALAQPLELFDLPPQDLPADLPGDPSAPAAQNGRSDYQEARTRRERGTGRRARRGGRRGGCSGRTPR